MQMKLTILFLSLFIAQVTFAGETHETLLSIEKIQLKYQRLLEQYNFLNNLEELNSIPDSEKVLEGYLDEVESSIKNNPVIVKEGAWDSESINEVKNYFDTSDYL